MDTGTSLVISTAIGALVSIVTLLVNVWILRRTGAIHELVNSSYSQLVHLTGTTAHARGVAEGRAEAAPGAPPDSPHPSK
jgi:hypothetical protein